MNKSNKNQAGITIGIILAVVAMVIISIGVVITSSSNTEKVTASETTIAVLAEPTTQIVIENVNVEAVNTISLGNTGDVLIHEPIYTNAYVSEEEGYDFSFIYEYSQNYITNCDYFVGNLEVTFGGTDGRSYSSYPLFNAPDELATALFDAGFDLMLTSNNHCYDTSASGLIRTQTILEAAGLEYTGTQKEAEDKNYTVVEVDGINIGMLCYTYETDTVVEGNTYINGILIGESSVDLINSFSYYELDTFYAEVETALAAMEADGADVSVVYMHWGDEYNITQNSWQTKIATALCELGVDVIVGGHPHVVQPMELITSEDGTHSMVVAYSLGNSVSNQRRERMDLSTGHTEDGMFLTLNFTKYTDGSVLLSSVEVVPTWVDMYYENSKTVYNVLALGETDDEANGITGIDSSYSLSSSYDRTMDIVSEGLAECNEYLEARAAAKLLETMEVETIITDESVAA